MALSIGVKIGSKLTVGSSNVKVTDIVDGSTITIDVDGKRHVITDSERTEILKEVFVSSGLDREKAVAIKSGRLAFEAPRSILIKRVPA